MEELTRLYGKAAHKEVFAATDSYDSEVATVPYQGDAMNLLLFDGIGKIQGELK